MRVEIEEKGAMMATIDLDAIDREISHIQKTGRPSHRYETEKVGEDFYSTSLVSSEKATSTSSSKARKS